MSGSLRHFSSGALNAEMLAVEGKQELLQATLHLRGNAAQPAQLRCPCHTVRSIMTGSLIVSKS